MKKFLPEGYQKIENTVPVLPPIEFYQFMQEAKYSKKILQAKVTMCDSAHNLYVDLGPHMKGIIPKDECTMGANKDVAIISRVNKIVSFVIKDFRLENNITTAILSRKDVMLQCKEEYIDTLKPGMVIKATVSHLEAFGCFVDIGCGIISFIPIDLISVSRITHAKDRFYVGQNIYAVVVSNDGDKVYLSHKELLGSWDENACLFEKNQTVCGVVRSIESYGVFIELTPNLAGLAELKDNVFVGQQATVFIKNIIPEKMKVKLILIDTFFSQQPISELKYYINSGTINRFCYSSILSDKHIVTDFTSLTPIHN